MEAISSSTSDPFSDMVMSTMIMVMMDDNDGYDGEDDNDDEYVFFS